MSGCNHLDDCSDHGYCYENQCVCDLGWFSDACSRSGVDEWGVFWPLFRILFAVLFWLLAAFALRSLIKGMMLRRSLGCQRILLRVFKSPKNLSMGLILLAASLRAFWFSIDPLSFLHITNHVEDRLLYDSVFPTMYCVYCSVLLVWSGLYHAVTSGKRDWSKGIRYTIIVFMAISFAISTAFSVCQGIRVGNGKFIVPGLIFVTVAVGSILVGLCFFGALLHKYIVLPESDFDDSNDEFVSRAFLRSKEPDFPAPQLQHPQSDTPLALKPPEGLKLMLRSQSVPMSQLSSPRENSSSPRLEKIKEESQEWSVSEAAALEAGDGLTHTWSRLNSSDTHIYDSPLRYFLRSRTSEEISPKEEYKVLMSRQDKLILRQIILLTTLSAVIGVSVIGLTVLLALNEVVHESRWAILLLILASGMEFFAYIVVRFPQVLLIFSTRIKVKSKENLQFVSEVGLGRLR